jgi:hypothetical protein
MARMPPSVSSACAARSPILSCAALESRLSRRPKNTSGSTTMGRINAISPASFALVSTSIRKAPAPVIAWRTPMEMAEPISDCSSPISAVRRDMTSPMRADSK